MPARVAAAGVLAVAAIAATIAWIWRDGDLSRRALQEYVESRRAYAARELQEIATLPDVLAETSGLAVSRIQPGVLWSHNDSGDGPTLYAIDEAGRLLATVPLEGAAAQDWEDMAAGPCPAATQAAAGGGGGTDVTHCLYLADTGDNDRVRDAVAIYVVVEPRLPEAGAVPPVDARVVRFRYPDGPDDSEAIAVLPNGDVTIVTKGRAGEIAFFGLAAGRLADALSSGEVLTAEYLGDTGIEPDVRVGRHVTGAAVSPDGTTLAVRTYTEVYFYEAAADAPGGGRWRAPGRPCLLGDAEPQGEAIDYVDGETLLLTSERARGLPATLRRLRC